MKILSALLIAAVAYLPACARTVTPSSNIVTKTVSVGSFDEIDVSRVNLIVHVGHPTGSAKISAPDNLIEELKVSSHGGELDIHFPKNFNIKGNAKTTVEITFNTLKEIDASLSSKVEVRGALATTGDLDLAASTSAVILLGKATAGSCDMDASTSGSISIQQLTAGSKADVEVSTSGAVKIKTVQCGRFSADASTSGSVSVKGGRAENAEFEANTSGSINTAAMTADKGKAEASTGGYIKCNIAHPSNISTSTGGSINNNK